VSPYSGGISSFDVRKELVFVSPVFGIHIFTLILLRVVVVSTRTGGYGLEFLPICLLPDEG
jgi:hypothetical protein